MELNDYSFEITNDEGLQVKCDTLAILGPQENPENTNETYVIYTDYTLDSMGNLNVYISRLVENGEDFKLEKIEDYEKYPALLKAFEEEYKKLNPDK